MIMDLIVIFAAIMLLALIILLKIDNTIDRVLRKNNKKLNTRIKDE